MTALPSLKCQHVHLCIPIKVPPDSMNVASRRAYWDGYRELERLRGKPLWHGVTKLSKALSLQETQLTSLLHHCPHPLPHSPCCPCLTQDGCAGCYCGWGCNAAMGQIVASRRKEGSSQPIPVPLPLQTPMLGGPTERLRCIDMG